MAGPEKLDGAFRTIREVADWLGVPTHVLRFWESKFDQIAPVKGAGGRRYYRPEDMRVLGGIKVMLHDQGLTIRGVSQKIDDEGIDTVMQLSPDLDATEAAPPPRTRRVIRSGEDAGSGRVVPFDRAAPPAKKTPSKAQPPSEEKPEPQPDADPMPEQPGEEIETTQPSDLPPQEPETPSQPGVSDVPSAPEPDVDETLEDRSDERGIDPKPVERAPVAIAATGAAPTPLSPADQRKLRRVVRKLRGLIDEVEAEITTGVGR